MSEMGLFCFTNYLLTKYFDVWLLLNLRSILTKYTNQSAE